MRAAPYPAFDGTQACAEADWAHPRMGRFCPPALVAQYLSDTGGEP